MANDKFCMTQIAEFRLTFELERQWKSLASGNFISIKSIQSFL